MNYFEVDEELRLADGGRARCLVTNGKDRAIFVTERMYSVEDGANAEAFENLRELCAPLTLSDKLNVLRVIPCKEEMLYFSGCDSVKRNNNEKRPVVFALEWSEFDPLPESIVDGDLDNYRFKYTLF